MRALRLILLLLLVTASTACRSKKDSMTSANYTAHASMRSELRGSTTKVDSLSILSELTFDTLKINIAQPSSIPGEPPTIVSATAINGKLSAKTEATGSTTREICGRDSADVKIAESTSATVRKESVGVFNPPSLYALLVIAAVAFIVFVSKKR